MCRRVQCATCSKPTYAGCGAHIEAVLGDVPRGDRCTCREQPAKENGQESASSTKSFWKALVGG